MQTTKLELWCEEQWRRLGLRATLLRRELGSSRYVVTRDGVGSAVEYEVPLVPTEGAAKFRENFLLYWTGGRYES